MKATEYQRDNACLTTKLMTICHTNRRSSFYEFYNFEMILNVLFEAVLDPLTFQLGTITA